MRADYGIDDAEIARLVGLVKSSSDAIIAEDLNGIVQGWNRGAESIYGYSAAEMVGKGMQILLPPDHLEEESTILEAIRSGECVHHFATLRVRKDGRAINVSLTVSPIRDRRGQITGASHVARDVTDYVKSQRTVAHLAAIVDSSHDAIIGKSVDGVVETWNRGAERLYGYTASEMVGGPLTRLLPEDRADEEINILQRIKLGERVSHFDTVRVRKDGTLVNVSLTLSPIRDDAGEIIGISHVARDITVDRQNEEKLRLSQKMEAVGRLAGGIAHDFNNLLTIITGYTVLLQRWLEGDPEGRAMLEQVLGAATRAAELTGQLLAFSRRQVAQLGPVDFNEVISGMQSMLQRLIGEDIIIESRLDPELWRVRADRGQLGQVIMNLAVNARDAMPGGGKIVIRTGNWMVERAYSGEQIGFAPGDYVRVLFSDTGRGMDAATRAHVFEPFFTTKELGHGTGLGLPTVYGIVRQSGGQISVYSEVGSGTTFAIYLPREEAVETDDPVSETGERMGDETVLVVEDEPALRKLVTSVLRSSGYEVLEAANMEDAVRAGDAHSTEVRLLLTDVVMPGGNGRQLASLLSNRHADLKVLFMSGYSEHVLLEKTLAESSTSFLQKPFTPAQLLRKVRDVLDA
jgi:PAS domain S-box-containing protein